MIKPGPELQPRQPFEQDGVTIHLGDCRRLLPQMPEGSINCCVTSPPYWGLRDYGHDDQIGLEATPAEYVEKMVEVFREVRRVLRDDGTLWLNLGDSYAGSGRGGYAGGKSGLQGSVESQDQSRIARMSQKRAGKHASAVNAGVIGRGWVPPPTCLKPKDLVGIPWRVAFALQADGWYLRSDIIWNKPNLMPESVKDRCTRSHEYIFMLAKSERYYFDNDAIKEPVAADTNARYKRGRSDKHKHADGGPGKQTIAKTLEHVKESSTRKKRSVWTVSNKPYKGAHFATYPQALIKPCILAGCPEGGTVLDPFSGSGTTAKVANRYGRKFVGCELNPDYLALSEKRFEQPSLPFGGDA